MCDDAEDDADGGGGVVFISCIRTSYVRGLHHGHGALLSIRSASLTFHDLTAALLVITSALIFPVLSVQIASDRVSVFDSRL